MKKLLLLLSVSLFGMSSYAQGTCATAVNLTVNGITVIPQINGTYPATGACGWQDGAAPNAMWYKFTATAGGTITVSSDLDVNPADLDSRLSIYSGTCGTLTCLAGEDDVAYPTNNRSKLEDFIVTAGTTYYMVWDNKWNPAATPNLGLSFEFTYSNVTCFPPTVFGFPTGQGPTFTTATVAWNPPANGTPTGYDFEYGVDGFEQGSGTLVSVTTTGVPLTGLTPNTIYDFYVRANCGGGDLSSWTGPISFATLFEPTTAPYEQGFEQNNFDFIGWSATAGTTEISAESDWFITRNGGTLVHDGTGSAVSLSNAEGQANSRLFSRGLTLAAGTYTAKYWVRNYRFLTSTQPGAEITATANYQFAMGTAPTVAAQTTLLNTETGLANSTFEEKTVTVTVPTAGTYYFSFLHNSDLFFEADLGSHGIIIDGFSLSAPLGTTDAISNKFSVFPNPASSNIYVSNTENINVSAIQITDLNGRTVKNSKFVNGSNIQVNISDLASGMYMMNIVSDQGTATKKIMKN